MISRPQLLQVFLVGETATEGLHKQAFTACLDRIGKSEEYANDPTVRILGPYFSGSQVSLERTLQAWTGAGSQKEIEPTKKQFTIISGNANAVDKAELKAYCQPATVIFHATHIPENEMLEAALRYLSVADDSLKFKRRVACLEESNTTFGAEMSKDLKSKFGNELAYFPFPLYISEVRSAYQQASDPAKNDFLTLPSFGSKLRLPLRSGRPRDTEPSLTPIMSAVTTERILGTMLNTIAREQFPYAIILATDVKDKLFLATLLRQHCPETRLILSGNDLLFSHPDVSAALRGTIVASTYPLYPRNQHWTVPTSDAEHRHIIFPSEEAQGYYNATIALLMLDAKDSSSLLEYGPPFPALQTGKDGTRPPIWISIVGQGGLFPLAAIPISSDRAIDYVFARPSEKAKATEEGEKRQATKEGVFRPLYPTLWVILVLGITLLLVYVFSAYFAALWERDRWNTPVVDREIGWEMRELFWPRMNALGADFFRWRQRLYTFFCLTSLLALYAYLTFVWLIPFCYWCGYDKAAVQLQEWSWMWIGPSILAPLLLLIGVAFTVLILPITNSSVSAADSASAQTTGQSNERYSSVWLMALFSLALLVFLARYCLVNVRWPQPQTVLAGEWLLFFERATSLASGVSPATPVFLLAMAFFCWGYVQLKRLYLLEFLHKVESPFPEKMEYFEQVNDRRGELHKDLRCPERALRGIGAWIAWAALFFTFSRLAGYFIPSVEKVWIESSILLSLAVLALLIGYGWLHLCKVWKSTRELLDAIALFPKSLEEAFKRIPKAITGTFGPYLSTTRPGRHEQLQARIERLKQLAREYEHVNKHAPDALKPYVANLPLEMKNPAAAIPDPKTLRIAAQACFTLLEHVWTNPELAEKFAEPPSPKHAEAAPAASPPAVLVKKTVPSDPGPGNSFQIIEDIQRKDDDKLARSWLMRVQDFLALEVTVYLSQFFVHLRNLILFLTIAPFLMLLAVTSYPFQPQGLWLLLAATLIGVGTATVIWIVIQIERNEVVSHILSTTPNKLNFHWHFLAQILMYAAPLLGIVVAASSDASDLVHALVDPLIQALR
jgi:hypothetical protein